MAKNSNKPSIRFKSFTDAWEQCKLGDIGKTYGGLSGKSKEDFGHGDARFVTYMNVFSNPVGDPAMTEANTLLYYNVSIKDLPVKTHVIFNGLGYNNVRNVIWDDCR